jgi:hypothetical protein
MNTQHNGRNTQNKTPTVEKWQKFARAAERVEHAPTPEAPSSRSDAVDPRHRQTRLKKVERGLHAQSERKDSLAREDHAPISGEPRGRYFRQ